MENNDKLKYSIKSKIAISKFKEENIAIKQKFNFASKKVAVVACACLILTSGVVFAKDIEKIITTIIRYNPFNGKPVIVVGEEVPEELIGKEVSLMIPPKANTVQEEVIENVTEEINVVSENSNSYNSPEAINTRIKEYEQLERDFESIMYKYYGEEKINQILTAMNNENPETDMITSYTFPESGKILLRCVVEIFDTMNPTEEEKQVLREFSQMMLSGHSNKINDDELKERINNL